MYITMATQDNVYYHGYPALGSRRCMTLLHGDSRICPVLSHAHTQVQTGVKSTTTGTGKHRYTQVYNIHSWCGKTQQVNGNQVHNTIMGLVGGGGGIKGWAVIK